VWVKGLFSFPLGLKFLMREFGKRDGWMGFTGPDGALMAALPLSFSTCWVD
jgi:hypothetical protein